MYLEFLNYFRGFAIFLIVLGHTFDTVKFLNGVDKNMFSMFYKKIIFTSFTGGTSLFVFISGVLFHHIFYKRGFDLKKVMKNKVKNVFLPYTIVVIPSWLYFFYKNIYLKETLEIKSYIKFILIYLSGISLAATWYIPFAFLLYICSPIFIKYINIKKYKKI